MEVVHCKGGIWVQIDRKSRDPNSMNIYDLLIFLEVALKLLYNANCNPEYFENIPLPVLPGAVAFRS